MKSVGRYDSALQMFVEEPREVDLRRLSFMRWLVENNRLEHEAVGPASGEFVVVGSNPEDDGPPLPLASFRARREGSVAILKSRSADGQMSVKPEMQNPGMGGGLERFRE